MQGSTCGDGASALGALTTLVNSNTTLEPQTDYRPTTWLSQYPGVVAPSAPPDDDLGEPDGAQPDLPTGPTHVAARGRTAEQVAAGKAFMAAAGRVDFDHPDPDGERGDRIHDRGAGTLRAVWMAVCYYASLGTDDEERTCYAKVKSIAARAIVSERTVRSHLPALVALGLIQTEYRKGGHMPTTWSVSPSVRGGSNCRAGRQSLPGRAAVTADEVRDQDTSPEGKDLDLASKQPDGACAHPAARKQKKKKQESPPRQQTAAAEPTRAAEPTPCTGENTQGGDHPAGATEKQIKFLHLLADRVGADHAEDLWRAADPTRLQAQIKAAVPFKTGTHTHAAVDEALFRVGLLNKIAYKEVVQRCACGAARWVYVDRNGTHGDCDPRPWMLSGYLVDYLVACTDLHGPMTADDLSEYNGPKNDCAELITGRWTAPVTFSEVKHLFETLPVCSASPEEFGFVFETKDVSVDWKRGQ